MDTELLAALDDRAATYALLARLYASEVDAGLLTGLEGMAFPQDSGNEGLDAGARLMNGYLRGAAEDAGRDAATELAVDFCRLFVVRRRSDRDAPYPFESVYTSREHCAMGAARDEVLALYRAAGLEKDEGWKVGEDHVALELEYMATLAGRLAAAVRAGKGDEGADGPVELVGLQATFLDRHLLAWTPRLAQAMGRRAQTDFYRGLARFTVGYLEEDRALLRGLEG